MNKMPVLFVGHGSPMNAIEDNQFTKEWIEISKKIPMPKAILVISAHWYTNGTKINDSDKPEMIYDMYGFPDELYEVKHPVLGSPDLAHKVIKLLGDKVSIDNTWGYDHGAWSVLYQMYPDASIPVVQLSIDYNLKPTDYLEIGKKLSSLRNDGVLIMGSGNVVHNLSLLDWHKVGGFPWAEDFDEYIKDKIKSKDFIGVTNYKDIDSSKYAFFTPEHFYPILYVLGAVDKEDIVEIYNDDLLMGSLSMTSYLFNKK